MINKEQKAELVAKYGDNPNDSGKSEVQISILTSKINDLTQHLKIHPKDNHNRRGLIMMVSKRRKLLDYLMRTRIERYRDIIAKLSIRK